MKISFIYPPKGVFKENRNWMHWVAQGLEGKGHVVMENEIESDCDVILGMSIGVIRDIRTAHAKYPDIPLVLYNWDMHPMLQPEVGKWDEIGWDLLLEDAIDVWTQTAYHKRLAEEITGIDHYKMPICALDYEFQFIDSTQGDYALMASRRVPYKQFELFEEGCNKARVPFISRHPDYDDREGYIKQLAGCRVLVIASEEEANTPMSGYEGAFCKKPLLLSDIPPHREEWGENAIYFKNKDVGDFAMKLSEVVHGKHPGMGERAYNHAIKNYTTQGFVDRIDTRLCELLSSSDTTDRAPH